MLGVVKADVGIKDGKIVGIGKAGNPSTMDGVTPGLAVGPATDAISGEQLILTAGGHRHPRPLHLPAAGLRRASATASPPSSAAASGRPTAPTARPSPPARGTCEMMLRAVEGLPINFGFLRQGQLVRSPARRGADARQAPRASRSTRTGARTPRAIRAALTVADEYDVQVAIHTDTLNEAGYVEDTIAAFEGRTIHTYPHRGRRRRARPGHHQGRRRAQRPAQLDQPDAAVRHQHRRPSCST